MPKKSKKKWLEEVSEIVAEMDRTDVESDEALDVINSFGASRHIDVEVSDDPRGEERADDAPIVKVFRLREFEVRMLLQDLRTREADTDHWPTGGTKLLKALAKRHATCVASVKEASKTYKTQIRSLDHTGSDALGTHKEVMDELIEESTSIREAALALVNVDRRGRNQSGMDMQTYRRNAMPEQADAWRQSWLEISKEVNKAVGAAWSSAEPKIRVALAAVPWVIPPAEAWELDYIGSLAKGVKGAPKQHIAFDPQKFDVDANLVAPALAAWAVANGGRSDRDRLWGRRTPFDGLASFKSFQDAVHKELLKIEGYDAEEEFEVVVKTAVSVDDETFELVKEYIIELKKDNTLFRAFSLVAGVAAMLDDDGVPLPARADDLLGELEVFAQENNISLR